jgi:hypothetical protein
MALFVLGVGGAELLDVFLKGLFARPRPIVPDPLLGAMGYSFPSGHAMGSMAFYGLLAYAEYPPIEDYGLIGNCHAAALICSRGSIAGEHQRPEYR